MTVIAEPIEQIEQNRDVETQHVLNTSYQRLKDIKNGLREAFLCMDVNVSRAKSLVGRAYAKASLVSRVSSFSVGYTAALLNISKVLTLWSHYFVDDLEIELISKDSHDFSNMTEMVDFLILLEELRYTIFANGGRSLTIKNDKSSVYIASDASGESDEYWDDIMDICEFHNWKTVTMCKSPLEYHITLC